MWDKLESGGVHSYCAQYYTSGVPPSSLSLKTTIEIREGNAVCDVT